MFGFMDGLPVGFQPVDIGFLHQEGDDIARL